MTVEYHFLRNLPMDMNGNNMPAHSTVPRTKIVDPNVNPSDSTAVTSMSLDPTNTSQTTDICPYDSQLIRIVTGAGEPVRVLAGAAPTALRTGFKSMLLAASSEYILHIWPGHRMAIILA